MWEDRLTVRCQQQVADAFNCISRVVACLNASSLAPSLKERDTIHYLSKYMGRIKDDRVEVLLLDEDDLGLVTVIVSHPTESREEVVSEVLEVLRHEGFTVEHEPSSRKWY
jgi:hypothetical protein